jgi:hypothetical protein
MGLRPGSDEARARNMNSSDLPRRGFGSWAAFNFANKERLLAGTPKNRGVYCVRAKRSQRRLAGGSDIMYFRKATNAEGLK